MAECFERNNLGTTLVLKFKKQPALLLSSFMHNFSINEHKNVKLKENICFEIAN